MPVVRNFTADIEKWVETVGGDADQVVRATIVHFVNAIDEASPVGDPDLWLSLIPRSNVKTRKATHRKAPKGYAGGRFRASNQLGIDTSVTDVAEEPDPTGTKTVGINIGRIPDDPAGHVYWFSNNLPYARRLEFDHWSSQAPAGIYGLVARDFNRIVEQEAAKVRS